MDSKTRKMKPADFKLIEDERFNLNWPMSYNFVLGYVDLDYPKKKKKFNTLETKQI